MRSIKDECLNRVVPLGEGHLRRLVREYVAHYHRERNHQGRNNQLLERAPPPARVKPGIRRCECLGGLLNFYYREATVTIGGAGWHGSFSAACLLCSPRLLTLPRPRQAAALGLVARVEAALAGDPEPSHREVTNAFWHACRGGQRGTAAMLLERGAEVSWLGYDRRTALDAAQESGSRDLVAWLIELGAKSKTELA